MADDEQYSEEEEYEEEEEEVEAEEISKPAEPKPAAAPAAHDDDVDESNMTEAEKAMLDAKRRQKEEDEAKLQDYEERRKSEREREEEELRLLKEKQEQRRIQREEEEREQAERRKQEEERRKQEEEERKARLEEERKKKEEEKKKKAAFTGAFPMGQGTGPNFVLPEKKDKGNDKFGNIVQAKQEMGMTKEQQEEAKKNHLVVIEGGMNFDGLSGSELKAKIKEMHQKICKLEAEKYDLEKRHERQEYDLKELNERQRQVARNKALKKGLDPSDTENSRYPPKVSISSKYDRQIDRRNFKERRAVFDKSYAYPCFPNIPPPPVILEFKLQKGSEAGDGEGEQNVEEVEEEYDEE